MSNNQPQNNLLEEKIQEILAPYPDTMTRTDLRISCHIGTRTVIYLLQSGLIPNIHSGKKTRCYKIAKADVAEYLRRRETDPSQRMVRKEFQTQTAQSFHNAQHQL